MREHRKAFLASSWLELEKTRFSTTTGLPFRAGPLLTVSLPITHHSYEDYLDSQISEVDLYYLDDVELARQLVELGHRGNGEIVKRAEFIARKEASEIAKQQRANKKPKKLASAGKDLEIFPLLKVRRRTLTCLTDLFLTPSSVTQLH